MEPAALPAARMISRPEAGGAGRCAGRQLAGCAAATAVRNRPSRKARGDDVTVRSRSVIRGSKATCCTNIACALLAPEHVPVGLESAGAASSVRSLSPLRGERVGVRGSPSIEAVESLTHSWGAAGAGKRLLASLSLWRGYRHHQEAAPMTQNKSAIEEGTRTELEAAAFRRLVEHLR